MEAVKRGAGREAAHAAIKEHAVALAKEMRAGTAQAGDLLSRLAVDPRIGLSRVELAAALALDDRFVGAALAQADAFVAEVQALASRVPESPGTTRAQIL